VTRWINNLLEPIYFKLPNSILTLHAIQRQPSRGEISNPYTQIV